MENTVEQRVATLEASIGHIRSDIAEINVNIRRFDSRIDSVHAKLETTIAALSASTWKYFAALDERIWKQTILIGGLLALVAIAIMGTITAWFLWIADKIGH